MSEQAWPDKYIIGLTGNIATGKSAVMRLAAEQGALTIDADQVVHEILAGDPEMQAAIAVAFGAEVRYPDGRINRRALAEIVFNDPDDLNDLEKMLHPAVRDEINRRLDESYHAIVFVEAIKLLEGPLAAMCQEIWVTRCDEKVQMTRLRVCRGLDAKAAAARIQAQPPQAEKVAMADIVIETNSYMRVTEDRFRAAWSRIPEQHREELVRRNAEKLQERASQQASTKAAAQPAAQPMQRLSKDSLKSLDLSGVEKPEPAPAAEPEPKRPEGLETRRARPSDIPSILLHIQKATDGAVKMKRTELLMSFGERSYFIGQIGAEISVIIGFSIDSQVTRIDQTFIHPIDQAMVTGTAVLAEIYQSAFSHLCQLIAAFLPEDAPEAIRQMYDDQGYVTADKESLPKAWQRAIDESQPENTYFLLNILQPDRLKN